MRTSAVSSREIDDIFTGVSEPRLALAKVSWKRVVAVGELRAISALNESALIQIWRFFKRRNNVNVTF